MQSQKFIGTVLESNQEQGWQSYKSQFSIFSGHRYSTMFSIGKLTRLEIKYNGGG